ncbi:hypothetical protein UFOVP231_17 [uncultured Caudovirales phage]|uniref:Uncharacterized protein n=1 Tax=uncultured Caudovirales phage TaxID=2100421 RepID=A0A6J7WQG1_9CAUD|nr:hypothetical protein UFOVP231_17 [uncultured Caudovirales phage]
MATVINDIQPGFYPNQNGSPVFPATAFTGPLLVGNVIASDGTGNLAGLGNTTGTQNLGYVVMAQSEPITQASGGTSITIPAQSQIISMQLMVTTAWTGTASTLGIGATAGTAAATAFTTAGAVAGGTKGIVTITPGTATAQIANWDNVSNSTFQTGGPTDVQVFVTSTNTGSGVGTLTVTYIQGINQAS